MCLSVVYRGKKKKEALAALSDSFYCWKVAAVYDRPKRYYSAPIWRARYPVGWGQTKPSYAGCGYQIAWHFFLKKSDAVWFRRDHDEEIIRCKVKKRDVVAIGEQTWNCKKLSVIVAEWAWFPRYRKRPKSA